MTQHIWTGVRERDECIINTAIARTFLKATAVPTLITFLNIDSQAWFRYVGHADQSGWWCIMQQYWRCHYCQTSCLVKTHTRVKHFQNPASFYSCNASFWLNPGLFSGGILKKLLEAAIVAFSAAGVFPVHSEFWDLRDGVAGSSDSAASMWTDKVAGI